MSYEAELLRKAYEREAEIWRRASERESELRSELWAARDEVSRLKWDIEGERFRRSLNRQWALCIAIIIAWMLLLSVAFGFFVNEVQ